MLYSSVINNLTLSSQQQIGTYQNDYYCRDKKQQRQHLSRQRINCLILYYRQDCYSQPIEQEEAHHQ